MKLDQLAMLVRSDFARNKGNYRCLLIVTMYRLAHYLSRKRKSGFIGAVLASPFLVLYRFLTEWIFQYEIPAATVIGKGLVLDHGYGIVINKHSTLGDRVRIKHQVTIGCKTNNDGTQGPSPVIGSDVDIGAGAKIIGGIRIGSHVKVGAGAVVVRDVPDHCIAVGNPARAIPADPAKRG
jgi:putative colanic acid biosynthesis acetyltransferase WcaB